MMVGKNFLCENTKFIGIPISYLMYGQNIYNLEIMDQFDLICVDSEYSQDIAESIFKYRHKNIQLYNYSNLEENRTSTRINLGISNNTVKIYYIGTLEYNEKIIESIILSFYSASIAIPNISLLLYITDLDGDPEIAKKMDELLNNIKNNIRSKSFNKHFIIKDACTYNLLHMIHNTGDIIINMDISGSSTGLNKHFAKLYGNHIIDYSHIESITKYAQGSLTEFYMLPSEISLYKSIISRISDKNLSDTTTDSNQPKQTIGSIIDNA
jgi:hypothetical protein